MAVRLTDEALDAAILDAAARIFAARGLPLDSYVDDPAHLDPAELERRVRVVGALGAIGTVVAAAGSALPVPGLRPLVARAAQHVLRS